MEIPEGRIVDGARSPGVFGEERGGVAGKGGRPVFSSGADAGKFGGRKKKYFIAIAWSRWGLQNRKLKAPVRD